MRLVSLRPAPPRAAPRRPVWGETGSSIFVARCALPRFAPPGIFDIDNSYSLAPLLWVWAKAAFTQGRKTLILAGSACKDGEGRVSTRGSKCAPPALAVSLLRCFSNFAWHGRGGRGLACLPCLTSPRPAQPNITNNKWATRSI